MLLRTNRLVPDLCPTRYLFLTMKTLSCLPQGATLFCLLLAHQSHSQPSEPRQLAATTEPVAGGGTTMRSASEATAPLALLPNGTPGWLSLTGELPTTAPLTADVLGTGPSPVASHTWRGLPAGRLHLVLNLRNVPAGAYQLRLSQNGQQWQLPLAVK